MRSLELVTMLVFAGGCAQVLGVDEDWKPPTSSTGAGGAASTGGSGTGLEGAAGGGAGAGGAETCPDVKTEEDPKNCGACGRDCLGGACVGGACQPALIFERDFPEAAGSVRRRCELLVEGDFVYLAVGFHPFGHGAVLRFAKDGTDPDGMLLAENQRAPLSLAADGDPEGYLYFTNWSWNAEQNGSVSRVKKGGGAYPRTSRPASPPPPPWPTGTRGSSSRPTMGSSRST